MDYGNNIRLLQLIKAKMAYTSQRHDVIASNIANNDVPNYQAQDLKPLNFEKMAELEAHRLSMRTTSPMHLAGAKGGDDAFRTDKMRKTYETIPLRNNVVLEEQQKNLSMNSMEYQTVMNLYAKYASMFKTSTGAH
jgi:flagellar basal-body rod protein FlgB